MVDRTIQADAIYIYTPFNCNIDIATGNLVSMRKETRKWKELKTRMKSLQNYLIDPFSNQTREKATLKCRCYFLTRLKRKKNENMYGWNECDPYRQNENDKSMTNSIEQMTTTATTTHTSKSILNMNCFKMHSFRDWMDGRLMFKINFKFVFNCFFLILPSCYFSTVFTVIFIRGLH